MLKSVMFVATLALCPALEASKLTSDDEEKYEKFDIRTACVYQYKRDSEAEADDINIDVNATDAEVREAIGEQKIHVNFIYRDLYNPSLEPLMPYASSIYALSLGINYFQDDVFEGLKAFQELRYLDLSSNPLRDPPLEYLMNLKHLKKIDLRSTRIDPSKVAALRYSMSGVEILF